MKVSRPGKLRLLVGTFTAITLLPLLLLLFAPWVLERLRFVEWGFLGLSLFVLCRSSSASSASYLSFLAKILLGQLCLGLLFLAFLYPILHYIPLSSMDPLFSLSDLSSLFSWRGALHPWPMIALMGLCLAQVFYRDGKPGLFSSFLPKQADEDKDIRLKRIANRTIMALNLMAFLMPLSLSILGLTLWLTGLWDRAPLYGLNISTLLILIGCLVITSSALFRKAVNYCCRIRLPIGLLFLVWVLLLTPLFVMANLLAPFIFKLQLMQSLPILHAEKIPVSHDLLLWVFWAWWLNWTPLASSYLARIAAGRSGREIIMGTLAMPLLLALVLGFTPVDPGVLIGKLLDYKAVGAGLMLFSLGLISALFLSARDSKLFASGFMPDHPDNIYAKHRRTIKFIRPALAAIPILAVAYIFSGLNLIGVALTLAPLPALLGFLCLAILKAN